MTATLDRMYYSRREAARLMGLSVRTIDSLLASNRLRSSLVGGRRLISREALIELGGGSVALMMAYL